MTDAEAVANETIMMTRVLPAPRQLVYRVWTDPRYVPLWWGIDGATNPVCEMDVRPGGTWRIVMRTANGTEYPNGGCFIDVVEGRKLVYTDVRMAGAVRNGAPPADAIHTVTFEDEGDETRVTLACRFQTREQLEGVVSSGFAAGMGQSFDRLELLLVQLPGTVSESALAGAGGGK